MSSAEIRAWNKCKRCDYLGKIHCLPVERVCLQSFFKHYFSYELCLPHPQHRAVPSQNSQREQPKTTHNDVQTSQQHHLNITQTKIPKFKITPKNHVRNNTNPIQLLRPRPLRPKILPLPAPTLRSTPRTLTHHNRIPLAATLPSEQRFPQVENDEAVAGRAEGMSAIRSRECVV